jgi:hypothetical protein
MWRIRFAEAEFGSSLDLGMSAARAAAAADLRRAGGVQQLIVAPHDVSHGPFLTSVLSSRPRVLP